MVVVFVQNRTGGREVKSTDFLSQLVFRVDALANIILLGKGPQKGDDALQLGIRFIVEPRRNGNSIIRLVSEHIHRIVQHDCLLLFVMSCTIRNNITIDGIEVLQVILFHA